MIKKRSTVLILLLILLTWTFHAFALSPEINKTLLESSRQQRLKWWRQARFGMFIHWGLYAQLAGQWKGKHITKPNVLGEWIMYNAKILIKDYEGLAKQFNPVKFDADQWVQLAKYAGMKYIVITAKHCDGFAMYPSKVSQYNIINATPFNRDPLKELQKACRKHGIKLGFYYSHNWDWHHPHAMGLDNTWDFPDRKNKDPNLYYKEKSLPQVEELIIGYRPHILWFDVPTDITRSQSEMFLEVVRKHSPDCIINDRIGNGFGDYVTPEQYVPAVSDKPFEVCMTLNDTWGYKYYDKNWKTPATVIRNLVDITAKGGNYLLNVGPTAEGLIPPASVRILQEIGKWMTVNAESIYGTIANPLPRLPDDARCTAKPGTLYIHIFNWPDRCEFIIPAIKNKIKRIYLLADRTRRQLEFEHQNSRDIIVKLPVMTLPPGALNMIDTVIVIEYEGKLELTSNAILLDKDYAATFHPTDAVIHGNKLSYDSGRLTATKSSCRTANWTDIENWMKWDFRTAQEAVFQIQITYAAPKDSEGNEYVLQIADFSFHRTVESTGGLYNFKTFSLGRVSLEHTQNGSVSLKPAKIDKSSLMNLHSIKLIPVMSQN